MSGYLGVLVRYALLGVGFVLGWAIILIVLLRSRLLLLYLVLAAVRTVGLRASSGRNKKPAY